MHSVAEMKRLLKPTAKIWIKIDPYYQVQKCRPINLVSGNIRYMRTYLGFLRAWASNKSGVVVLAIFRTSRSIIKPEWGRWNQWICSLSFAISLKVSEITSVWIVHYDEHRYGFLPTPIRMTLNDLEGPIDALFLCDSWASCHCWHSVCYFVLHYKDTFNISNLSG